MCRLSIDKTSSRRLPAQVGFGSPGVSMKIARLVSLIGVCTMVPVTTGSALAQSKCSGEKIKAAGKKAGAKLTCLSKGLAKGEATDSTCLAKAEVKFSSTVTKAEAKPYLDAG